MMKKFGKLLMCFIMTLTAVLSFVGCGNATNSGGDGTGGGGAIVVL